MTTSSLFCNVCGHDNPSQATFCMNCGEPVVAGAAGSRNLTGLLLQDQLLKQRYRILAQIGRGGFAAVYKAEDTHLSNRLVAVKEMSQSGLSAKELGEAIAAFQHEARLLAGLQHPNLPRIYDHFSDRGRWYLVMDFIEGETLEDSLLRQPEHRLSLQETLEIGLQVCSVLDYLHTRRPPIIFRDLKPANIIMGAGSPKHLYLIDFGIARHFKLGQTKDTMPLGSPGYAAPEQYGKAQTTQQSDIYSLGVLLHHLLSGSDPAEKPFFLPPLRLYGPAMAELETLITHMTALDVEQRPTNVTEVQTALQIIKSRSAEERVDFQPQRPLHEETRTSRRPERERSRAQQERLRMQEQKLLPPVNLSRRRLIIGGLLTGAVLATGAGGLLAFLPKQHVKPQPGVKLRPVTTTPAPSTGHFAAGAMFGFDAQHTGFNSAEKRLNPGNVSRLQVAWLSQAIGKNYFSSPTVSGGMVYVGTDSGRLYALDAATGQTRWSTYPISTTTSANFSTPAVVNGMVYFCSQDSRLYAFDAVTGHLRWSSLSDNTVRSSPIVVNGVVYATGNEAVYAFDAVTGHLRWVSPVGTGISPVAVANNLIYITVVGNGAGTGRVYALDLAIGQTHWISDLITNGIDGNSSPTVANGLVYIGSGDGGLAAFDAATGKTRWVTARTTGSTGSSPAVAQGRVYLSNNQVHAFDATTGQKVWTSDTVGAFNADSTMVANGVVYVCSAGNNSVYALDAATGKTLWISPPTNGQIFTTPAVANGMVYLASGDKDGTVYAFRLPA